MKKLWGEKEVEAVLHRLDRLTQDEARTTAAQTLEVVYGLVQNMRVVMDGERMFFCLSSAHRSASYALDGKVSADGIQKALGTFGWRESGLGMSNWMKEMMQDIASEINKSKRELLLYRHHYVETETTLQVRYCCKTLESGLPLRILVETTTVLENYTTEEHRHGSSMEMLMGNGNRLARILIYGFTENVRV